ncbi:S-adenosyl-L-methionine-dependent methyltransferase [Gorgonomyces haynaldii]|nr:S-adenosyl-L-methionine-dependent methyltransferase [Gorgonomyces haynaldii]KAI8915833.1 S-adenosyl-L-methionine-dependent methyltransferase [Gorgonomyces haynaldii]
MVAYPAALYKQFRPTYPKELFDIVFKYHGKKTDLAIDVATGTGQTAEELSKVFKQVIGTDISESMVSQAHQASNITYSVATAENFAHLVKRESVDLITASEAAHWFDMPQFYNECLKALKPGGSLCYWGYAYFEVPSHPELTRLHKHYSDVILKPWWDERRQRLDRLYSDPDYLESPLEDFQRLVFDGTERPFLMRAKWNLDLMRGYLSTWSPYKKFKQDHPDAEDVLDKHMKEVSQHVQGEFEVCWPVVIVMARKGVYQS